MRIVQSNTHQCFVCGIDNPNGLKITFESDGEGKVWARKRFSKEYQGYPGIVHGGILAAVLDEAAGRATMKHKRPEVNLVTGKLSIRYRKPVHVDELILVEAMVVSHSGRVYQCESRLKSEAGELLAEAEVMMVEPGQELALTIVPADDQWIDQENVEAANDR
jgi:uncharacterized protein (TIGR00369 family)